MRVFISWSGTLSRQVAEVMRDWLPLVVQSVEPFMSSQDIRAGDRWQRDIADRLSDTDFGIVCVTKANQKEPWLNFEAGALAKAIDASRVIPLAIDLAPSDIEFPLGQFQATPITPDGMKELVTAVNAACSHPVAGVIVAKSFEFSWQEFSSRFDSATHTSAETQPVASSRSERHMLEEVLDLLRARSRPQTSTNTLPPADQDDARRDVVRRIARLPAVLRVGTDPLERVMSISLKGDLPHRRRREIEWLARDLGYETRFTGPPTAASPPVED
jgi:hypothetical protein